MSSVLVIVGPRALNVQLLEALDSGRPHIDVKAQWFQRLALGCAEIAGVGPNLCKLRYSSTSTYSSMNPSSSTADTACKYSVYILDMIHLCI